MNRKTLLLIVFVLVAVAQLLVPKYMISNLAGIARTGKEYKFKVRHQKSDFPSGGNSGSTLQGRFLWLQFEASRYTKSDTANLNLMRPVYIYLSSDSLGFAKVQTCNQNKPVSGSDWLKTRAYRNIRNSDSSFLVINFPFNNYYIEDKDLKNTEDRLTRKLKDPNSLIYLKIFIRENHFLISDLVIDGQSFKDFAMSSNTPGK
ncbi:MAG: hypothetical protein WCK18_03350 [Prolixibacteraceae bacterium]